MPVLSAHGSRSQNTAMLHSECQTTKQDCPKYNMIKQNRAEWSLTPLWQQPSSTFSAWHPFPLPLSLREAPLTLNNFICPHQLHLSKQHTFPGNPLWGITWPIVTHSELVHKVIFSGGQIHTSRELTSLAGKGVQPSSVSGHTLTTCVQSHPP